jgi:hypothetical protein
LSELHPPPLSYPCQALCSLSSWSLSQQATPVWQSVPRVVRDPCPASTPVGRTRWFECTLGRSRVSCLNRCPCLVTPSCHSEPGRRRWLDRPLQGS